MSSSIELSAILPVYNEQECIEPVLRELDGVLRSLGRTYEIVAVDDGSTDQTPALLARLKSEWPHLRVLRLSPNSGQSAAMGAGFQMARGAILITLDADGQNDPAEIPRLLKELDQADVCCGYRLNRQDTAAKRYGSRMANAIRNSALGEDIRDTGCTLKAFKAEFVRNLPMELKGMHRFLPALVRMRGARIAQIGVRHRQRSAGQSKYTNLKRLKETVGDLRAVRWMQTRFKRFTIEER
jgi:dolichol-phosphate mannosyltransferase